VWRKKREKLEAAKQALEAAEVGAALTGKVKTQDAATPPTQGYVSRLKNLQQDRSTIRGDEMSR